MKLHKDRDAFQALLSVISEKTGIREDIDLTVEVQDCSKSQGKKRLETAARGNFLYSKRTGGAVIDCSFAVYGGEFKAAEYPPR